MAEFILPKHRSRLAGRGHAEKQVVHGGNGRGVHSFQMERRAREANCSHSAVYQRGAANWREQPASKGIRRGNTRLSKGKSRLRKYAG